jgi:hypothetical protein
VAEKDPLTLATDIYRDTLPIFRELKNLEMIVLCGITPKTYMWKGTKQTETFNTDARIYNDALTDITIRDNRYMKWTHRGTSNMEELTLDGTHLNSKEGFKKHINSITRAIKTAKRESIIRKYESSEQTVARIIGHKRQKAKERKLRKKAAKAATNEALHGHEYSESQFAQFDQDYLDHEFY